LLEIKLLYFEIFFISFSSISISSSKIENYFSMLKSRLQKLEGLKYGNFKENIKRVISEIPKEKYENLFKGTYKRPEKYVPKNKTRKITKNYK